MQTRVSLVYYNLMNSTPETEDKEQIPSVEIGQIFDLFKLPGTEAGTSYDHNHTELTVQFNLCGINAGFPRLPLHGSTQYVHRAKKDAFTPFTPGEGYQVDNEDWKLETRAKKYRQMSSRLLVDEKLAPLNLNLTAHEFTLQKAGLALPTRRRVGPFYLVTIKPEFLPVLKRLRVQVFFPGSSPEIGPDNPDYYHPSSFESMPWKLALGLGAIEFRPFYPLDIGPLPHTEDNYSIPYGCSIMLPDDPEKLKSIKARFILLPEPAHEEEYSQRNSDY